MTCLPSYEAPPEAPAADPGAAVALVAAGAAVRVLAACCPDAAAGPVAARWPGLTVVAARVGAFCHHAHGYTRLVEPGAVVVGQPGDRYACAHPYGGGDAGLVFQFAPGAEADLARAVGGVPLGGVLAPAPALEARVRAAAALASRPAATRPGAPAGPSADPLAFEEAAHGLALAAAAALRGPGGLVPPSLRRADRDRAHAAAQRIEAGHAGPLALADLAAAVDASPFHFLRLFRAELGLTPHQALVAARLRHALARLAEADEPVTEVAYAVGFGDLSHFQRTFRRAVGCTPGAYRARLRT